MKIVIDIPDAEYEQIQAMDWKNGDRWYSPECVAIHNGIPLPEGHGALKDFEKIYADVSELVELARQRVIDTPTSSPCYMRYVAQSNERTNFKKMLYDAPTIIEADKGGEQG